jgi:hypothetical protein
MKTDVAESSLDKIFRLTGVPVGGRQAKKSSRSRTGPEQVAGGQLQLGSTYRSAWGNVHVGDVLEFGPELWKVIPASSYPNHPSSLGSSASLSAVLNAGAGSQASGSAGTGAASGGGTAGTQGGMDKAEHVPTHTVYLQDVKHPASYDELTLPTNFVVTIVPVAPALSGRLKEY